MSTILNVNNFTKQPSEGDTLIYIYEPSGKIIMQIDPYSSSFTNNGSYVYIITDGKQNYQNILQFNTNDDASIAVSILNSNKNYFITKVNNTDFASNYDFTQHTGNTNLHINNLLSEALNNSNNPSSINPFMTIDDISVYSGDTKEVKISNTDDFEGYLIDKISGSTYVTLTKLNHSLNEILQINVDLSDFYNKSYIDNNLITTALTINDISGYTKSEVDNKISIHTGDTTIHFTKSSINLDDLGNVNVPSPTNGQVLVYSGSTWLSNTLNIYTKTEIDNKISGFTTTSDFNSHTGSTNPHKTSFFNLTSTAHTHNEYSNINHNHNTLYYTKNELTGGTLDSRYYTKSQLLPSAFTPPYGQGDAVLDARYYTRIWIDTHYYDNTEVYTKAEVEELIVDVTASGLSFIYYTKSDCDERFINVTGDTMIGDLSFDKMIGYGEWNTNINNDGTLIKGNQYRNTLNINGTTAVDIFEKNLDYGAFWYYTVRNGTNNIRTGVIYACWDDSSNSSLIEYASNSTMDIGDTTDIVFYIDIDSGNQYIRLFANCTLTWQVKIMRVFI